MNAPAMTPEEIIAKLRLGAEHTTKQMGKEFCAVEASVLEEAAAALSAHKPNMYWVLDAPADVLECPGFVNPSVLWTQFDFPTTGFMPLPPMHPSHKISDRHDCEVCFGAGWLGDEDDYDPAPVADDTCDECGGVGHFGKSHYAKLLGHPFDTKYLALLAGLPECEVAIGATPREDLAPMLAFRFAGGGQGLLMPVRGEQNAPRMDGVAA